jgi:hypothetical protein
MEDIVKITLWLPDQQALNKVLSKAKVSLDCGAPRRESDGSYRVILYASPEEAKKIKALGYRQEADEANTDSARSSFGVESLGVRTPIFLTRNLRPVCYRNGGVTRRHGLRSGPCCPITC